jgi:hypothetical protein
MTRDFSGFNVHYQQEFRKIQASRESYKGRWNWAAFLGGAVWGYYQGVWLASTLMVIVAILTLFTGPFGFILSIVYWFVFGYRGTFLLYSAAIKKRQLPI